MLTSTIYICQEVPVTIPGRGCTILEKIQSQIGQGSEQPDVVEDVSAHCRGVDQMSFKKMSLPTQTGQ